MTRGAAIAVLALLLAAPAAAQPAPADPIDALLRKDADPEEPDTAATGSRVDPDPIVPTAPRPYVPHPTLTAPVRIEETGKSPDGPPSPADLAYDSRIRSSMASAQAYQGPMYGAWVLSGAGRDLYAFQLLDRNGVVEGAWRDLRRKEALDASGFIDLVERTELGLVFRIGDLSVALHPDAAGWAGELIASGRAEPVSLRRKP